MEKILTFPAPQYLTLSELVSRITAAAEKAVPTPAPVPEEYSTEAIEGYMGAPGYRGNHCQMLFGAELSAAIREALKKDGQKGVSVRCSTFAGGQEITVTVKASPDDYTDRAEYIASTSYEDLPYWIRTEDGRDIHRDAFWGLPEEERRAIMEYHAAATYDQYAKPGKDYDIASGYIDDLRQFTPAFRARLHRILLIIQSHNFDESNGMVDYFNTLFYSSIRVKNAAR